MPVYEGELVGYSLPTVTIKAPDGTLHTHACHHTCKCDIQDDGVTEDETKETTAEDCCGLTDLQLGDHVAVSGCPATSLKVTRKVPSPQPAALRKTPPATHQQPVAAPTPPTVTEQQQQPPTPKRDHPKSK